MRIALVGPLPPLRDGIADYTGRLAASYREAGHDVAVVASAAQADSAGLAMLGSVTWSPLRLARLLSTLARWRPDVLHVQHGIATYGVRLLPLWTFVAAARLRGVRVVITHHEVTRDIARLGSAARSYYRVVSRRADVVHVHTHSARTALVDMLGVASARVLVLPHPVFELPPADVTGAALRHRHGLADRRVFLLFGFVHVEKGLRELVDGLAVLVARDPAVRDRIRLVVAGDVRPRPPAFGRFEQADRSYLDQVRRRCAEPDLAGVVVFTGHVPSGEVGGWFAAADAAVLPYTQSEQSGVANLAIAAGVPVLTSRAGGLGDLFAGELPTFESLGALDIADALEAAVGSSGRTASAPSFYRELIDAGSPARLADALSIRLGLSLPATVRV